ncbi:bis(5'-nucleosyl)-tetraphosphatase (symmetrical) YqeK [uncultured Sphaerochaeta sp.]|uniref:bis(5'-nucleosyl)-tetraphosphatase (symmetrical) YqeK n=1 Tax=uncultured Sphaerochaeta sp. TaxID=886478 RepID=UPI002A0A6E08|nr:bis(5'-nucleosyl)-tetraphosphatase (symmetrical) YqeK [uncultured Sphaerochaeta sp.]
MFSKTNFIALEQEVRSRMSERRYLHSLGTAQTCVNLAQQFNEDISLDECYECGLLHDIAREWPDAKLQGYSKEHQLVLEPEEKLIPMLLHGPVAADILKQRYSPSLCLAVRYHTLGSIYMGRMGLILFIADFLEPGRTHLSGDQRDSLLAKKSLEEVCSGLLDNQDAYFESKGKSSAFTSVALRKFLREGGEL